MATTTRKTDIGHVQAIRETCALITRLCREAVADGLDVIIESEGEAEKIVVRSFVSRHF